MFGLQRARAIYTSNFSNLVLVLKLLLKLLLNLILNLILNLTLDLILSLNLFFPILGFSPSMRYI